MSGNKHITDNDIRNYFSIQIDRHFNPTFIRNQLISLKRDYLKNGNLDIFIIDEPDFIFFEDCLQPHITPFKLVSII